MKQIRIMLIALLLMPGMATAKDLHISMIYSNAMGEKLPYSIFEEGGWAPDPHARFVKLHMYFDEPVMVKSVAIDTCGEPVSDYVSSYLNFDQSMQFGSPSDGLKEKALTAWQHKPLPSGVVFEKMEESIELRSLTFNFEKNTGFKVCGIILKDEKGEQYRIRPPKVVPGSVSANSVLAPQSAYSPVNLFDSRFEYGWASNKQATDVGVQFHFDGPRRIEKIRIWNGYQRSVKHCYSNSRARRVHLSGDNGYSADIEVKDILGSQVIELPKPFEGKELKLDVVDAYLGKSYKDLVISELRFFDGENWFLIDPTATLHEGIRRNREAFEQAGVLAMLNDSYVGGASILEGDRELGSRWMELRLRADGSFFLSENVRMDIDDDRYTDVNHYALGNFEIKEADAKKRLKLRLFGLYYETETREDVRDCNGCGRDCNRIAQPEDVQRQKIFQEFIVLRPAENGEFIIENLKGGKTFKFDQITLGRERD